MTAREVTYTALFVQGENMDVAIREGEVQANGPEDALRCITAQLEAEGIGRPTLVQIVNCEPGTNKAIVARLSSNPEKLFGAMLWWKTKPIDTGELMALVPASVWDREVNRHSALFKAYQEAGKPYGDLLRNFEQWVTERDAA